MVKKICGLVSTIFNYNILKFTNMVLTLFGNQCIDLYQLIT